MSSQGEVRGAVTKPDQTLKADVNWNKKPHTKMLKMPLLDCVINLKNVAVLMEDGAFAVFSRPHPGEFDSSKVPVPVRTSRTKPNTILNIFLTYF